MYSSSDILRAMDDKRLSISDFDLARLGTNSYDLLLGNTFFGVTWDAEGPLFTGPHIAEDGQRVYVPVGGTMLGMTREIIGTHYNVVAQLKAKSSLGRMGITICRDAGLGDVGYDNHWTLEISSYVTNGKPFVIVGEPIAQMIFYEVKTLPANTYTGQYKARDWPMCMIPEAWRHRIIEAKRGRKNP